MLSFINNKKLFKFFNLPEIIEGSGGSKETSISYVLFLVLFKTTANASLGIKGLYNK